MRVPTTGVPRASNKGDPNYDAAAALGVKQQVPCVFLLHRLCPCASRQQLAIWSPAFHTSLCCSDAASFDVNDHLTYPTSCPLFRS